MKIKRLIILVLIVSTIVMSEIMNMEFEQQTVEAHGAIIYSIRKHTISSAGGVISAGNYIVTSSIGQIDAKHNAFNGIYTFIGGFLQQNTDLIFKNNFE